MHTHFSTQVNLFVGMLCTLCTSMCVCVCMRVHISTELSVLLEAFKLDFCCLAEVYADTGAFDSVLTHGQPCMTDCFLKKERRRAANRGGIPKMCGVRQ